MTEARTVEIITAKLTGDFAGLCFIDEHGHKVVADSKVLFSGDWWIKDVRTGATVGLLTEDQLIARLKG